MANYKTYKSQVTMRLNQDAIKSYKYFRSKNERIVNKIEDFLIQLYLDEMKDQEGKMSR